MLVDVERGGRKFKVLVPDDAPKSTWDAGITLGPPDLTPLGLPSKIATRLHNELFNRGLITSRDVRKRGQDVFGALQAALAVDSSSVIELYRRK